MTVRWLTHRLSAAVLYSLSPSARDAPASAVRPGDRRRPGLPPAAHRASDFVAAQDYTYDDCRPPDRLPPAALLYRHDETQILPLLRERGADQSPAHHHGHSVEPAAWMKTSDSLMGPPDRRPEDLLLLRAVLLKFVQPTGQECTSTSSACRTSRRTVRPHLPGHRHAIVQEEKVISDLAHARAAGLPTKIPPYDTTGEHPNDIASTPPDEPPTPTTTPSSALLPAPAGSGVSYHCYYGTQRHDRTARAVPGPGHLPDRVLGSQSAVRDTFSDTLKWHARKP